MSFQLGASTGGFFPDNLESIGKLFLDYDLQKRRDKSDSQQLNVREQEINLQRDQIAAENRSAASQNSSVMAGISLNVIKNVGMVLGAVASLLLVLEFTGMFKRKAGNR